MEIVYNGKVMGSIDNNKIEFKGYDLNPFIEDNFFDIVEDEDELGNVFIVKRPLSFNKRILLLKELGFEIR